TRRCRRSRGRMLSVALRESTAPGAVDDGLVLILVVLRVRRASLRLVPLFLRLKRLRQGLTQPTHLVRAQRERVLLLECTMDLRGHTSQRSGDRMHEEMLESRCVRAQGLDTARPIAQSQRNARGRRACRAACALHGW